VEVGFFGGSFTGIPVSRQIELLSVAKKYMESGVVKGIRLSTRPDYIDNEILENLQRCGVTAIELGVQSMDDDVLSASYRGHTSEDTMRAVNLIKKYPFKLGLQMMVGLPKDNYYKDIKTAKDIIAMRADFVRIYPTLVIKNTYLEKLYREYRYKPLTIPEAVKICKDIMLLFTANDIPIIRLGLQTSKNINQNSDVVAGPFIPNFGELVESELIQDMILYYLHGDMRGKVLFFTINPLMMSKFVGYKKQNIEVIKQVLDCELTILLDKQLGEDEIKVEYGDSCDIFNKKSTQWM
jgi:Radical SAM superfamily.